MRLGTSAQVRHGSSSSGGSSRGSSSGGETGRSASPTRRRSSSGVRARCPRTTTTWRSAACRLRIGDAVRLHQHRGHRVLVQHARRYCLSPHSVTHSMTFSNSHFRELCSCYTVCWLSGSGVHFSLSMLHSCLSKQAQLHPVQGAGTLSRSACRRQRRRRRRSPQRTTPAKGG